MSQVSSLLFQGGMWNIGIVRNGLKTPLFGRAKPTMLTEFGIHHRLESWKGHKYQKSSFMKVVYPYKNQYFSHLLTGQNVLHKRTKSKIGYNQSLTWLIFLCSRLNITSSTPRVNFKCGGWVGVVVGGDWLLIEETDSNKGLNNV